jgi:iduronate 2-sulfatase
MRLLLLPLLIFLHPLHADPSASRTNVLLIVADDLRCDISAFGNSGAVTPNVDRLAARSRVFGRAYCQQALCNPSRASMMTGLRPDRTGVTDLRVHFRERLPEITTVSQHFKNNGYEAVGLGKIYHNYHLSIEGDPASWSRPQRFHWGNHRMDQPQAAGHQQVPFNRLPATQCVDVPDNAYIDGRIADAAVEALGELRDKPFFLAVGFWKPHLPYNAPKRYWDLYDRSKIAPPDHPQRPQGAPDVAIHGSPEPRGYHGMPAKGPLSAETLMELRHGYLAGVSYLDANVGKVLSELDRLDLTKNTVVVFWSDNGYHLGENGMVGKLTNFERDTRVPLMIATPGLAHAGSRCDALVEMVDLYPTLLDLCDLPPPPHKLEGVSLRPLVENPAATVKTEAFSQHPDDLGKPARMGYSVRTADFRYTEWRSLATGAVVDRELYQYDDRLIETRNLANDPRHSALVAGLAAKLPPPKAEMQAPPPPGTVIHHSPASSGLYIGSPSICILSDGSYLASHDLFGPQSNEHQLAKGRLYRSTDKGATWRHLHDFEGFFWTGLFVHRGAVFLLGLDKHHGRVLIRRSRDFGQTWTPPVVLAEGQWHTAPVPVIEHAGRLWRAIEDAENGTKWGERYRARMMSAPADADLLDPESWTFSNPLARDATWLDNDFAAWLEGNAVADPQGAMVNILRADHSRLPEKAAIVHVSKDGKTATFDPASGFVDFPGGTKKFTIRKDPQGGGYWSLATIIPDRHAGGGRPASIRNTLALVHSKDLRVWEIRSVLLHHPDVAKHGFQYVDWQFAGNDLIAACRTAWDDAEGGARNNHDANFLTFHRWKNFRRLTRADDVVMPGAQRQGP